jgi:hypothetical protein
MPHLVFERRGGRVPARAIVGAGARLPVELGELLKCSFGRAPGCVEVGAGEHCPWDEETCMRAVDGGHIGVLKWARDHGCDWNADTCFQAATEGHLEVLRWAHEHGCPWGQGRIQLVPSALMCNPSAFRAEGVCRARDACRHPWNGQSMECKSGWPGDANRGGR